MTTTKQSLQSTWARFSVFGALLVAMMATLVPATASADSVNTDPWAKCDPKANTTLYVAKAYRAFALGLGPSTGATLYFKPTGTVPTRVSLDMFMGRYRADSIKPAQGVDGADYVARWDFGVDGFGYLNNVLAGNPTVNFFDSNDKLLCRIKGVQFVDVS